MAEVKRRKPVGIIYDVDDKPPLQVLVPLVLQQIMTLSVDLMFPVIIIAAMGGTTELAQSFVSLMMISMGIGTIMQACKNERMGSGYLCAHESNALLLPVSVLAVKNGGLHLLLGMTVVAGAAQVFFSKIIHKLRVLFPVEITGLIIMMLPISVIRYSFFSFVGHGRESDGLEAMIAFVTLTVIMAMFVWGKTWMRQYSIVIGIIVGFLASYFTGILTDERIHKIAEASSIAIPNISHVGWSFDIDLLFPFLLLALCSSIKTLGNISACQKANDENWVKLDIKTISGGLFAEGLGTLLGGFMGSMGQATSSGSIGLAMATGAISRYIGYWVGAAFIVLAFFPKLSTIFAIMPEPVMAAILVVETVFIVPAGMQMCTSRMLDYRKSFVLGLAFTAGLAVEMFPGFETSLPIYLQPLFRSSLSATALIAILLNLFFRIGIAKHQVIEMTPGVISSEQIADYMEMNGATWGARRDIIHRAAAVLNEFIESAVELQLVQGTVKVDTSFEEFNLNIDIYYEGTLLEFPETRPTEHDCLTDTTKLSGFLIKQHVDWLKVDNDNNNCHIQFHFDH